MAHGSREAPQAGVADAPRLEGVALVDFEGRAPVRPKVHAEAVEVAAHGREQPGPGLKAQGSRQQLELLQNPHLNRRHFD